MDDQRVGRVVRALRRRLGWRQSDLARAAGCSQNVISLVERGHLETTSLRLFRRVLAQVDAVAIIELHWRGAALDRLLDEDHARLGGAIAAELGRLAWEVQLEVSYSIYGERGSIDLLAWHAATRTLLVIEIKTDLPSAEATLRKLDEKVRLAPAIARERFGWNPAAVSRLLILPNTPTLRRRAGLQPIFETALPVRNVAIKQWLREPGDAIAGLWFFSNTDGQVGKSVGRGPQRVRSPNVGTTKRRAAI